MKSFTNQGVRLLQHGNSIIREDHLEKRWEEATGEVVDEVIFFSKHTAVSNKPALTVHPIGIHLSYLSIFQLLCCSFIRPLNLVRINKYN